MFRNKTFGSKTRIIYLCLALLMFASEVFYPASLLYATVSGRGPILQVTAVIEPCINITLSTNAIVFDCKGAPGIYYADQPVVVDVGANYGDWTLKCSVTALENKSGRIPSERIFIRKLIATQIETKSDRGFESMVDEKIVLTGSQTSRARTTLEFKIETTWEDKPG